MEMPQRCNAYAPAQPPPMNTNTQPRELQSRRPRTMRTPQWRNADAAAVLTAAPCRRERSCTMRATLYSAPADESASAQTPRDANASMRPSTAPGLRAPSRELNTSALPLRAPSHSAAAFPRRALLSCRSPPPDPRATHNALTPAAADVTAQPRSEYPRAVLRVIHHSTAPIAAFAPAPAAGFAPAPP
ncbi:hypothetical protein B0H13DRAFT_2322208 [Mycena leptocephala]|nr:hypothetical protein B0H13DRAFT_2322208 [Mycena leptocephala]